MVIFKRTTIQKGNFPKSIIVKAKPTGWITMDMFLEWLNLVRRKTQGVIFCTESLLIYDSANGEC